MILLRILVLLTLFVYCKSAETPVPPSKISACSSFNSTEECVMAKEINFTLAYYLSSKETSSFSLSGQESSKPQFTKLKSSSDLNDLKKKITDEKYIEPPGKISMDDMIQYIQDEREGLSNGKSAADVKKERELAMQNMDTKKRPDDSQNKKLRERMEKEIEANPYLFEITCASLDDTRPEMEVCASKLKPNLKIFSDKKLAFNYSTPDFLSGSISSQIKLTKDFSVELTSSGQDSLKLFSIAIKQRIIKEDSGKLLYSTGKVYTKMGQSFTITP